MFKESTIDHEFPSWSGLSIISDILQGGESHLVLMSNYSLNITTHPAVRLHQKLLNWTVFLF